MLKISDLILEIVEENHLLSAGIAEGILNLSQVARLIHPLLEVRAKKEIKVSAIIMNLSRLTNNFVKLKEINFSLKKIIVNSGLSIITFPNLPEIDAKVYQVYSFLKKQEGYITISHGGGEITIITEEKYINKIKEIIQFKEKALISNVSSVGVVFDQKYGNESGILYALIQSISMQGINILEISSTYTEFICYIDSKYRSLCFNTLQKKFF